MPTYTMKHKQTGEIKEMILSLSEREALLDRGEWEQMLATPKMVTGVVGTLKQAGDGWKDLLGEIKKGSGRGNTIKN